jgi:hypothetical protein
MAHIPDPRAKLAVQAIDWGPIPPPWPFKKLIQDKRDAAEKFILESFPGLPHPPPPFIPAPARSVPEQKQVNDSVDVSRNRLAANYNPVQLKGFSENRPEILCVTDFEPAYRASASTRQLSNDRSLLPVGEKLKVMLALARLRNHNIKQLMTTLREDKDAAKIIDDIEREYDTKIESAIDDIRALTSLAVSLEKARDALNVRKSQTKISQKMASRLSFTSAPMGYIDILEEFGFNRVNVADFSNTKILMQIINDYNVMLANYSPGLLGIENDTRKFDDDPFDIIENLFDPKKEPQVLDDLRQQSAAGEKYYDIMNSLFGNMASEQVFASADNRIKFLANFIAKELVVSAGLGRSSTKAALQSTFAAPSEGNVFDNILGVPGGDVLEAPHAGKNALAGFMNVMGADNTLVLPFESPLTEDDDESFVTGTEFFIDSIMQGQAKLDPTPLANFVGQLGTATSQARNLIERRLLSFRGNSRTTRPTGASIFGSVLEVFNDMYSTDRTEASNIANKRFALLSLMKLATDNPELKSLLYQYTLAIGINRGVMTRKSTEGRGSRIYRQMVRSDIQYVEDFPIFDGKFAGAGVKDVYKLKRNPVPIEAIDSLIMKIMAKVTSIVGPSLLFNIQKTGGDTKRVPVAVISEALREMTGERSVFQAINSLATDLTNGANRGFSGAVNNGYFVDTTTFRTRFNFISPAVMVGLIFEMFVSVSSLTGADITSRMPARTAGTKMLNINSKDSDRAAFSNAVARISSGGFGDKNAVSPATSRNLRRGTTKLTRQTNRKAQKFDAIMTSLTDEDNFLATVTSFIFSYMDHIKSQTKPLVNMMRQARNRKSAGAISTLQRLQAVQKRADSDDIFATLNPAQIALSIRQAVEIQRSMMFSSGRNVSAFSDPEFLDPGAEQMLFALLREPKFKEGRAANLKILTVGLPTGFKSSLRSTEIEDESTPGPEREADVININVYRRDLEFEDIVFKPMSFTFELSRFTQVSPRTRIPKGKQLLGVSNSIASAGKVKTFNIQVDEDFRWGTRGTGGLSSKSETILNVAQRPGYDWMDEVDKKRMFQNHVINYFLNLYLKLLTDIDFSESTFLVNNTVAQVKADKKDRDRFVNLMLKRVNQVAGRTVTLDDLRNADPMMNKLLNKLENSDNTEGVTGKVETSISGLTAAANIEISENVVNFMKSFSPDSFLTGADVTSTRLVSPKLFERIFHMAVDLDEFDIDVRQTNATRSGRDMYKSSEFRSAAYQAQGRVRMKPRSSKEGEQIMSELFINVESKLVQESSSDEASSADDEKIRLEISGVGKRTKPNLKFNRGIK